MTKLQALGIISLLIFAITLLYTIYAMWKGDSIESVEPVIVMMLVSVGLGGLFVYSSKPKQ
ncbi:MAG: hypothetical protein KGI28_10160 [Thaumarchaeota archaeon]|nr:hypothetical protein [Nitrososphaerota archaeon]